MTTWTLALSIAALVVALGAAISAARALPNRLLTSLRRAVREAEATAERCDMLDQRFETLKIAIDERLEAFDGLADRITRERKRVASRDRQQADQAQRDGANGWNGDGLAELRQKARAQGLDV